MFRYKSKYKKVGVLPIQIALSVSALCIGPICIGPLSERNQPTLVSTLVRLIGLRSMLSQKRTELDQNECEHFLKANRDRSKLDPPSLDQIDLKLECVIGLY